MDLQAITDAIYDEMVGNADLLAALGGSERRLYPEEAPQDPKSPYCVYELIAGVPDPTFNTDGEITQFQFSIFNETTTLLDRATINDVLLKLCACYDDAALTITGHSSIAVTRGVSRVAPNADATQQIVVDYEIMIEDD